MKIKPLFQDSNLEAPLAPEQMLEMMDIADENPKKRAFLNQCAIDPSQKKDWEDLNTCAELGKHLPSHNPEPSLRARILENAYAERDFSPAATKSHFYSYKRSLSGWRWAWAALFLIMSWGTYGHFQQQEITPTEIQQLENEISSIYEELEWLREDLVLEIDNENEETA